MFDASLDESKTYIAERCADDRHHFRFIVSPHDALEMSDLPAPSCELMSEMELDLGTKLSSIIGTPYIRPHRARQGQCGRHLMTLREYIKSLRAEHPVTLNLGPRCGLEIRRGLDVQVDADRWMTLDRSLGTEARAQRLTRLYQLAEQIGEKLKTRVVKTKYLFQAASMSWSVCGLSAHVSAAEKHGAVGSNQRSVCEAGTENVLRWRS